MHTLPLPHSPHLLPHAATTAAHAFRDDDLFLWLQPRLHAHPDNFRQCFVRNLHGDLNKPGTLIRVAVSDDSDPWWDERVGSQVLGVAIWERTPRGEEGEVWGWDGVGKRIERLAFEAEEWYRDFWKLDPTYDYAVVEEFESSKWGFEAVMREHLKREEGYMWLNFLAVEPDFQRRGVGRRLMEWGIKKADGEGLKVGLVASPMGEKLYESVGFRHVGWLIMGPVEGKAMVRWPGGEEKEIQEVKVVNTNVGKESE